MMDGLAFQFLTNSLMHGADILNFLCSLLSDDDVPARLGLEIGSFRTKSLRLQDLVFVQTKLHDGARFGCVAGQEALEGGQAPANVDGVDGSAGYL